MVAWSEASGNVSRTQSFQKSLPPSLHCHYDLQYRHPPPFLLRYVLCPPIPKHRKGGTSTCPPRLALLPS